MQNVVEISGRDLDPAGIAKVARFGAKVVLSREAIERIANAREVVDEVVRKGDKIYGVTSSVGAKTGTMLAPDRIPEFNHRLLLTHNMGHGPLAPHETVRAMMVVLLNSMATGYLGVRPVMAEMLAEALNTNRRIEVHLWGSMGQSDMSPIADLALELYKDHEFAAGEALALLNSSALSIGTAALAVHDLARMLDFATLAGAFSMEGFAANPSIVSEAALNSRPFDGVLRHGRAIRTYLAGSYLMQPGGPRHLQDPLSFRSLPLIQGNAADSLAFAGRQLAIELGASQNNPIVAIEQRQLISVANFDMIALAMALDTARLAMVPVVTCSTERLAKQADSFWSGLSVGLIEEDGVGLPGFNGLAQFHKSITSEARLLGAPVVGELASSSHSNGNLDRASMAGLAARRTAELATLCLSIFGMELMVAAQAVEMRKAKPLGAATRQLFAFIRQAVPYAGAGQRVPHAKVLIDRLAAGDTEIDRLLGIGQSSVR